ncbi:hypothetical protein [Gluconacetobacter sp.]|uniref:hypothetical protein n=1 Tax=Gluconacetobacter sp. TaxID=1935994 RepID=UPI0039E91B45
MLTIKISIPAVAVSFVLMPGILGFWTDWLDERAYCNGDPAWVCLGVGERLLHALGFGLKASGLTLVLLMLVGALLGLLYAVALGAAQAGKRIARLSRQTGG